MGIAPSGLAGRLILGLTALIAVISGAFAYITVREQQERLLDQVITGVDQVSQSITSATWYMMLLDRREMAYEIMRVLGRDHGVESIRIFNKEGRITFSTDPNAPQQVDKNAEACFLCHAREEPLVRVNTPSRARIFRREDGSRRLGMIRPIYNEPACSEAECHAHPPDKTVLGVLDIVMTIDYLDEQAATIQRRAVLITLIEVLLLSLIVALLTRHFVSRPIRRLIAGTKAVSAMELEQPIDVRTTGELKELADSFNVMQARLRNAIGEINAFTRQLEQKVDDRTRELSVAQQRLIQSDRLASLGQLAATVAHEINNPISSVLNLSMVLQRMLHEDGIAPDRISEFRRYLSAISEETTRVGRIVTDLLAFSRRPAPRKEDADLNKIIRETLSLLAHKLKLLNASLELQLAEGLPPIYCDSSQIEQVVVNLTMNAAEALQGRGRVSIRTRLGGDGSSVILEVEDTGAGIPKGSIPRIFDPFYTTKGMEKGVGLGLSVVHGIVSAHGGSIDVQSRLGEGTVIRVQLPIAAGSRVGREDTAHEERST